MADTLKFYLDTHISKQVALQLRQKGIDVVRCEEAGMAAADDEEHLEYAANEGRVLISADQDFTRLHHQWIAKERQHRGIFFCQSYLAGPQGIGAIVKECLFYYEAVQVGAARIEEISNHLTYIG
jgi:hypothetical protein